MEKNLDNNINENSLNEEIKAENIEQSLAMQNDETIETSSSSETNETVIAETQGTTQEQDDKTKIVNKKKLGIKWVNILMLIVAGIVNASGVTLFLTPANIIDSGISGTSMVINYIIDAQVPENISVFFPVALFLVILNIPLFIIGIKKIGLQMLLYSFVCIGTYAFMMLIYSGCGGLYTAVYDTSFFEPLKLPENMIIASIFGGLLSGAGSGIAVKFGGAMDGVDVISVLLHKKLNLTVGQVCMIYNAILYVIFACLDKVTNYDRSNLVICLYSLIAYYVGLKSMDMINTGFDRSTMALVISNRADEIAKEIDVKMGRGVTFIKANGYFKGEDIKLIYCVVNRFEINKLRNIINEIDDTAFVTFTEVGEIIGKKLSLGKRSYKRK